jgi:hypothetical protein
MTFRSLYRINALQRSYNNLFKKIKTKQTQLPRDRKHGGLSLESWIVQNAEVDKSKAIG